VSAKIAKWICIKAGNLAVRLAPHAGMHLALRVGKPKPTTPTCPKCSTPNTGFYPTCWKCEADLRAAPVTATREPQVFDLVCQNCYDVMWTYGHSGVEALDKTCETCGAREWRVKPHTDHQQSRKA
jgi:hypothetical protein